MTEASPPIASWRRGLAYWWYAWGLSWCYWGVRSSSQTCFRAGIRSFDRALRLWPEYAGAIYRRGLIRGRELNEHAAAIADMTRAIELEPEWPEPYLQRGLFQRFHGDPHAALADLQHYLTLPHETFWQIEASRQIAMLQADLDAPDA